MNADGKGLKRLTSEVANAHDPDWSPDGTKIIFASNRDGDWEIYTMNATDGTNVQQLTSNTGIDDNYPIYSPDGQMIAFSSNRSGNEEIWIKKIGGGSITPTFSIVSSSPTISPTTIIGTAQTFDVTVNKNADIVWHVDGSIVRTDNGVLASSYTDSVTGIGTHIVNVTATNGTNVRSKEWIWTVQDISGTITIISPNGGENWIAGTTNAITWTYTGSPGEDIKIELLNSSIVDKVIMSSTPNDGLHSWTIPYGQANGSGYKIRITSTSNPVYTGMSDNPFSIYGTTATKVNLKINITKGLGSVDVLRNDSGIWTSLGATTTTMTYSVVSGTQLNITAIPYSGYMFEKWVTDKGIPLTINPLVVYQKYAGTLNTYFNVTTS